MGQTVYQLGWVCRLELPQMERWLSLIQVSVWQDNTQQKLWQNSMRQLSPTG